MDPASSVVIEISHQGASGKVELTFEEWRANQIDIAFRDRLYRNSGFIRIDGEPGRMVISVPRPYTNSLSDPNVFDEYFRAIFNFFGRYYTFGWSPAPNEMISYDAAYHESNQYTQGDPREVAIKWVQARIIADTANPRKCVIAGCSNGELVRQCRSLGIDASGFDVIPNISEIAFPEVREYLRHGSLTAIPFTDDDKFDTLVAIDVLEHIPERDVARMVEEWVRLGVRRLVLLINLNQFWYPGHITLRPLEWWAGQWKPHFKLRETFRHFPNLPTIYSNAGQYNQQWTLWERLG